MTVLEVLRRARELVANKWRKGGLGTPEEGVCAVGGIFYVLSLEHRPAYLTEEEVDDLEAKARGLLHSKTEEMYPGFVDVVALNDDPLTKHDDILAVYDKVILELEEKVV